MSRLIVIHAKMDFFCLHSRSECMLRHFFTALICLITYFIIFFDLCVFVDFFSLYLSDYKLKVNEGVQVYLYILLGLKDLLSRGLGTSSSFP